MNNLFSKSWFENLDAQLRKMGLDSDDKSFDEIKENLSNPKKLNPIEFADAVIGVNRFGLSGPGAAVYTKMGFNVERFVKNI